MNWTEGEAEAEAAAVATGNTAVLRVVVPRAAPVPCDSSRREPPPASLTPHYKAAPPWVHVVAALQGNYRSPKLWSASATRYEATTPCYMSATRYEATASALCKGGLSR
ncbi:MAG: hypothetical protein EOL87_13850 [Spartobacteria bacterium]|nr:hypothetical protein [Spartobacteria bacterium]